MEEKQERYTISEKTYQEFIDHTRVLALEERGIVQCGIATCRDFFSVYRKNQKKHMLLYTVRGKGWLESGACRYELEPDRWWSCLRGLKMGLEWKMKRGKSRGYFFPNIKSGRWWEKTSVIN